MEDDKEIYSNHKLSDTIVNDIDVIEGSITPIDDEKR